MGMRDRLSLLKRGSEDGGVRQSASKDLYTSSWTIVPSLQWPSHKSDPTVENAVDTNPLLFSPVYRLATRMGALPIKVYGLLDPAGEGSEDTLDPEGNVVPIPTDRMRLLQEMDSEMRTHLAREEVPLHPGAKLLHRPNPFMHRQSLVSGTVAQMLKYGHAGWLKDRDGGKGQPPAELWPLPAQNLEPIKDKRSIVRGYVLHKGTKDELELPFDDVCYFRLMPGFSDWAGRAAPIQALALAGAFGGSALVAMTELFDQGILSPIWIDLHGKTLSNRNQGRLQKQMEAARRDRFGIPVMEDSATLETLGDGPSDELLTRSATTARDIIREAFGIPEGNDLKAFYGEAVQPIADAIEQELVRSLFTEWEDRPSFAEFQYRDILRGSPAERIELHSKAILTAQETINEARRDENRPPISGGDVAYVPLNVLPVSVTQETDERPPADSGDGLGGDEGKGTFPSAADDAPTPKAATTARNRWRSAFRSRWGTIREHVISRQVAGFDSKARGMLKQELKDLRKAMGMSSSGRARVGGYPEGRELVAIVRAVDEDLADTLAAFMENTGTASYRQAAELLAVEVLDIDRILRDTLRERAEAVATRFGEVREDAVRGLLTDGLEKGWTVRELDTAISERYSALATHFIDGIGRTEMAFAYERAAYAAWLQGGVEELEFVFGGGPCTTGMCEDAAAAGPMRVGSELPENAGASFDQALSPPLHPGCTCFMVPFIAEEGAAEA